MARFGRYEEAVALAQRVDLLDVAVVMRELDVNATVAAAFMARLVADGVVAAPESGGVYKALRGSRRRSWSEAPAALPARGADATPTGARDDLERQVNSLAGRVRELEMEIAGWRRRALDAEASLARASPRIDLLRRRLAKALHPDSAAGHLAEHELRAELFKRLWPSIEEALTEAGDTDGARGG